MGTVIIGATMSLDWFMNDRHGDLSRLYPDMEALRRTEMLDEIHIGIVPALFGDGLRILRTGSQ